MDLKRVEALVASGTVLYKDTGTTVTDVGDGMLVKHGRRVREGEGLATQLVSNKTSIPVPKIFAIVTNKTTSTTYIVQEKLPGDKLLDVLPHMDGATRTAIAKDLTRILQELSKLDEEGEMGEVGRSYYEAGFFSRFKSRCEAKTTQEFIAFVADYGKVNMSDSTYLDAYTRSFDTSRPKIFSHGDFVPDNILVEEGRVTGIIDWESAGWYPYFWNDYIARLRLHMPEFEGNEWEDMLPTIMTNYPEEVAAFRMLFHYADVFGN
jgi:Ser/Thr protein kinase RdoA (MazF antagonist)